MTAICLVFALTLATAPGAPSARLTADDKVWLASVEAFITKAERKQYERLDGKDRVAFRLQFWARRDPDPATPENEALEEYTKRRRFVDQYFQEDETPGVMTERGRLYMKFGAPAIRRLGERNAAAGGSMAGSRLFNGPVPAEIWIYDRPPAARPGNYRVIIFVDENRMNRFGLLSDEQRPKHGGNDPLTPESL